MKLFIVIPMVFLLSMAMFGQNIERMFQTDVRIYLYKAGVDPDGPSDLLLRPVERMVPVDFELQHALQALFEEEISEKEVEAGFSSPTFGMKLEGVSFGKGTATVKFSQPADQTNYGSLGPMIFAGAVTKTAKQFPSVRRVRICAIGETMIDSELDRPFPRCSGRRAK